MSAPPQTLLTVSADEAAAIRRAVRHADLSLLGPGRRLARDDDVAGLIALLSDPIYDLPRPFTPERIADWVAEANARQARGEAILALTIDDHGEIAGYCYFTVWPDRSAAELAGAQRADAQGQGKGKSGAARSFGWMFDHLGVRLIGLTAALDNVRSARVIEAAGFVSMGQRESRRADGTTRQSLYWELTRERWRELSQAQDRGTASGGPQ